jgi:mono/diheme cytochrome c family protein
MVIVALLMIPVFAQALAEEEEAADASTLEMGATLYRKHCQNCHGEAGHGDGLIAKYLTIPTADLTRISERSEGEFRFGEVYDIVDGRDLRGHGTRAMPVWGPVFKVTEETPNKRLIREKITALVHYLESIQVESE